MQVSAHDMCLCDNLLTLTLRAGSPWSLVDDGIHGVDGIVGIGIAVITL